MQNVSDVAAIAAATLCAAQSALVLARTRFCVMRHLPVMAAAALILMALHPFVPAASLLSELDFVGMAWLFGSFLLLSSRGRGPGWWTGANLAVLATILVARGTGDEWSVSFQILRAFLLAVPGAVLLGLLLARWNRSRSLAALAVFSAGCVWAARGACLFAAGGGFAASVVPRGVPELLVSMCTGWVVFQEGFPLRPAWRGGLPGLERRREIGDLLYDRLHDAESALETQDHVLAAGFLALGAAHDLKNTLTLVRLAAHHGLDRPQPDVKDECLRQIVQHTETARDSALDVLDRIAADGGDVSRALSCSQDLVAVIRRAAVALRGRGIVIHHDLGGVRFRARRFDVEQIVVNLIRNAAESCRRRPDVNGSSIAVTARVEDDVAVIEVRDWAGGVEERLRPLLFSPSASGTGSTGLGLYLSRNLALRNGGSLDYFPTEGGSAFRLCLPAAEYEPARAL